MSSYRVQLDFGDDDFITSIYSNPDYPMILWQTYSRDTAIEFLKRRLYIFKKNKLLRNTNFVVSDATGKGDCLRKIPQDGLLGELWIYKLLEDNKKEPEFCVIFCDANDPKKVLFSYDDNCYDELREYIIKYFSDFKEGIIWDVWD